MLAASVSRWWWAGSHLLVTVGGTVVVIASAGLGVGVGYAAVTGDAGQVVRLAAAALATAPAVLVLVGVAVALFGWLPRAAIAAWGALAVVTVIGVFATVLRLPRWLVLVSPSSTCRRCRPRRGGRCRWSSCSRSPPRSRPPGWSGSDAATSWRPEPAHR